MISAQKQPSCEKGIALKSLGEKSCEIKGGGQQMAAMMLMLAAMMLKAWVKKSCEIKGGGQQMAAMMLMLAAMMLILINLLALTSLQPFVGHHL